MTKQAKRASKRNPLLGDGSIPEVARSYLGKLEEEPERGRLRFYFQDVNTLNFGKYVQETDEEFQRLASLGILVVCLGEVNKNMVKE